MSKYYKVDVVSITSKVPRSEFDVEELDQLAKSILASGGLLSPLLLRQTGIESYEVIAGDLEYYAAARAKELSPREGEMVNAFIVKKDAQEDALEQFKLLQKASSIKTPAVKRSQTPSKKPGFFGGGQLNSLEEKIDEVVHTLKQTIQQDLQTIEKIVSDLQEQLPNKVDALEVFNHGGVLTLVEKLADAGIKGKTAETIINGIEKARKKSAYISFKDIVSKTDGLAERRLLSILDGWGGIYMDNSSIGSGKSMKSMILSAIKAQSASAGQAENSSRGGQAWNLEARIVEFMQDFRQIRQQEMTTLGKSLESLQSHLPHKVKAIDVFNQASQEELERKMAAAHIKGKTAEKIIGGIVRSRKKSDFSSLRDVVERVASLGESRMLTLLDSWAGLY